MKKILLLSILILGLLNVYSQTQITLTFHAKDSLTQNPLALDSVNVKNLTVNCDTTLYDSVSVLTMDALWPVGIGEPSSGSSGSFIVMQNVPNPFQRTTMVPIYLKQKKELNLAVYDIQGKKLSEYHNGLEKGWHSFAISTNGSRLLFLMVSDKTTIKMIKILSTGSGLEEDRVSYVGETGQGSSNLKSTMDATGFIFYLGNQLMYTAYVDGYHASYLFDSPVSSETYTFAMLPAATPTAPTVSTSPVTDITQTTATSGGNVISDGGATVTARGVCWSTSPNPDITGNHTTDGSGAGNFVSYLTGLTPNNLYYIRAYATNSVGTGYGNELQFSTLPNATLPVVTTSPVTDIAQNTATSGGIVTSDGGATVTARGVCWSTSSGPTTSGNHTTDGSGTGSFVSYLTGLTPNTLYYVRAYATNNVGTAYGNEVSFTTTLVIGDSYQGGKVAYILQPTDPGYVAGEIHGLIAAPSDQADSFTGTGAEWGCSGTTISGADGTAIGTGNQNTIDIMAGCAEAGRAARLCGDLVLGGYSDWYLPSKDELNQLYINRVVLGCSPFNYWSSSEYNAFDAWVQYFTGGDQYSYTKLYSIFVRAVRAF